MRKQGGWIVLTIGLLAFNAAPVAGQPGGGEAGKLMAFVALPKIVETLTSVERIGAQVAPDEVQPGMLVGQLGAMLGDPTFENLDKSRPICLFVFTPEPGNPKPTIAVYIPAKNAAPYDQSIAALGMQSTFESGTLVAGESPEAVEYGKGKLAVYNKIVAQGITDDVRLYVSFEDVMNSYGFLIDMGLQQMLSMMEQGLQEAGGAGVQNPQIAMGLMFTRAYAQLARNILRQSKNMQFGLSLSEGSLDGKVSYRPKSGTAVAEVLSGTAPTRSPVLSHMIAPYSIGYAAQIEPARIKAFIDHLIGEVSAADPKLKELITDDVRSTMSKFLDETGGAFAATLGGRGSLFNYAVSGTIKSEEGMLAAMEDALKLYHPGGPFAKLMGEGLKVEPKLTRNVRQSGGANVHRSDFKYDYGELGIPEESKALFEAMPTSYELAVIGGFFVGGTVPATVDGLITRAKAGGGEVPFKSFAHYGDGKSFYMDMDVGRFVGDILGFLPGGPDEDLERIAEILKGAPPVMASGSLFGGKAVKEFHLPMDIVTRVAGAARGAEAAGGE